MTGITIKTTARTTELAKFLYARIVRQPGISRSELLDLALAFGADEELVNRRLYSMLHSDNSLLKIRGDGDRLWAIDTADAAADDLGLVNPAMPLDRAPAISEQDMHLLPRRMRELAEVVGLPAFLVLVEYYGGGAAIRVPVEANPDHHLWELIGPEAFRALVALHQAELIEIAKCERAARELQRRSIRYEYFSVGASQDALAKKYRLTVRHIRNILYYISEPNADGRQGDLF